MSSLPDMNKIAALISAPSRLAMLSSLLGGKALTAGELARAAHITPQTASSHLAKLVEVGLLKQEAHGRHKFFQLAGNQVAQALETLFTIAPLQPVRSLRESDQSKTLRYARICYDHLAGKVGVALTQRLLQLGLIVESDTDYVLSTEGRKTFVNLGVDVDGCMKLRRHFARPCLDWSERQYHLAGSFAAALTKRLIELKWIDPLPGSRAVRVTDEGKKGLMDVFGLNLSE